MLPVISDGNRGESKEEKICIECRQKDAFIYVLCIGTQNINKLKILLMLLYERN